MKVKNKMSLFFPSLKDGEKKKKLELKSLNLHSDLLVGISTNYTIYQN